MRKGGQKRKENVQVGVLRVHNEVCRCSMRTRRWSIEEEKEAAAEARLCRRSRSSWKSSR
jgi:hypothetical protein